MPVHIEWHTEYRAIDERTRGKWTPDDIRQHNEMLIEMLEAAQRHAPGQKVYHLLDLSEAENLPPVYRMIRQALPVLRFKNRGQLFFVTNNKTIRSIVEVTGHVMKFQMRAFGTRKEALEALQVSLATSDLHLDR